MTDAARLPTALRRSAVPRWSHRDPVEGGNPFPVDDVRHPAWTDATRAALDELARLDAQLARQPPTTDSAQYRARVVDLASRRFDAWARRGLSVVDDEDARAEYEQWLHDYTENWVRYVADTVPRVAFGRAIRDRLADRAIRWSGEARARLRRLVTGTGGRSDGGT